MATLVQGTQATQAKDTQVTLTQTKRPRKFELFNPKPSLVQLEEQLEEQHRLGAVVQPYLVIM